MPWYAGKSGNPRLVENAFLEKSTFSSFLFFFFWEGGVFRGCLKARRFRVFHILVFGGRVLAVFVIAVSLSSA